MNSSSVSCYLSYVRLPWDLFAAPCQAPWSRLHLNLSLKIPKLLSVGPYFSPISTANLTICPSCYEVLRVQDRYLSFNMIPMLGFPARPVSLRRSVPVGTLVRSSINRSHHALGPWSPVALCLLDGTSM
jgi:hypothetical protein